MIITLSNGQAVDTDRDLSPVERHILQKLLIWQEMASDLAEFREHQARALQAGWDQTGPVRPSQVLSLIIKDLEKKVAVRLAAAPDRQT
jgi:hypothetical protein